MDAVLEGFNKFWPRVHGPPGIFASIETLLTRPGLNACLSGRKGYSQIVATEAQRRGGLAGKRTTEIISVRGG